MYLVARGVPGVVAFLAIPLFSRMLDPADYGRYALVTGAVLLLNALLFQWMRLALVRYLPAYKDQRARLKSTLVTGTAALVLLLAVIGAVVSPFIPQHWRVIGAACWGILAVQAAFELCCEYARADLRPGRYMTLQLVRSIAFVGLGVALVRLGWRWWGPLLGTAAGMAAGVLWAYRGDWKGVRLTLDRQALARVARYGIPLSLTVALTVLITTTDRFLIAWLRGEDTAGLSSVAFDFTTQTLTLLMLVIHMAMFPLAVRAWENEGPRGAQEQMRSNAALLLAIGVPSVVGLTVLAPGIADCFLGESYRTAAAGIMPLIALGAFVGGLKAFHFDAAFQFAHRTLEQVWIVLLATVVNVGLNLVAVPRWGIEGAAAVSVLTFVLAIVLSVWVGRRHFAVAFPVRPCVQVLLASAGMGLLLLSVRGFRNPLALAAQMTGGAAVYGAMLAALNFMGIRDAILRKWPGANKAAVRVAVAPQAEEVATCPQP